MKKADSYEVQNMSAGEIRKYLHEIKGEFDRIKKSYSWIDRAIALIVCKRKLSTPDALAIKEHIGSLETLVQAPCLREEDERELLHEAAKLESRMRNYYLESKS